MPGPNTLSAVGRNGESREQQPRAGRLLAGQGRDADEPQDDAGDERPWPCR